MTQRRTVLAVLLCLPLLLGLKACPSQPPYETARDSIAAAKGFIEQAQLNHHAECTANPSKKLCKAINTGVEAQNAAIDALDAYCAGPAWNTGGVCDPQASVEAKLDEAIRNLNKIIANLKELAR